MPSRSTGAIKEMFLRFGNQRAPTSYATKARREMAASDAQPDPLPGPLCETKDLALASGRGNGLPCSSSP